jgi:hypothetical protein
MNSPKVIRVYGKARIAYDNGERIERQEEIFVPSERGWFYTVDTFDHFVYRQERHTGSSLMCSCGSSGGIYNYDVYSRFTSINRGRLICCNALMQTGRHADGSSG